MYFCIGYIRHVYIQSVLHHGAIYVSMYLSFCEIQNHGVELEYASWDLKEGSYYEQCNVLLSSQLSTLTMH